MRVFVVSARGLHLGHLGCYGNDWIETPAFDRLAADGVVFDGHFADAPSTSGAWASWRGGRYRLPTDADAPPFAAEPDLLTILSGQGVFTALVRDGSRPPETDAGAGWRHLRVTEPGGEGTPMEYALDAWQEALDAAAPSENALVWLELATPLPPWDVPEAYQVRYLVQQDAPAEEDEEPDDEPAPLQPLANPTPGPVDRDDDEAFLRRHLTAAGAATYLDAGLALVVEELQRRQWADDALLVVTGDFGYPLGEHGIVGPVRPLLHDELTHAPLLMRWPRRLSAGRRVAALTQALDLMPTLLDAFGVAAPAIPGASLLPLARGEKETIRPYALSGLRLGETAELAVRSPEWAFLLPLTSDNDDPPRGPQLFSKPDDRWEVNDVSQHYLDLCDRLAPWLRAAARGTVDESGAVFSEGVA